MGNMKKKYKPKEANIKKLDIYLTKLKEQKNGNLCK